MSTAILTGPPVAASPIEGDLRDLGFALVTAGDPADTAAAVADTDALAARLAAVPAGERVAVVDRRFTGHVHALRLALTDPRFPAAAVAGALSVQAQARPVLARALTAPTVPAAAGPVAVGGAPLPDALASLLEAEGVVVHRPELGVLIATVPADEAERATAQSAVASVDDEAVRLRSAVKSRDGFFTTHFVSPYSRYIARWCARRGLTPNQVTTAALLVALLAAASAATGTRPGFVAAGGLLLASFVLDCTDGQLARYSLQYSTLGAWLDATFDRAKEYAYYAGLALGASRGGSDDVWTLALGAMVLQICRHVVDFSFNESIQDAQGVTGNTSPAAALSDRLDRIGWTIWLRRMIVLPIGERWALIALFTAATTPRITLYVLLTGCALAACYTTAGRLLRTLTRKATRTDRSAGALAELTDSGLLAEAVARVLAPLSRRLPAAAAPAVALLGAAALVITSALAPAGSWWPVLAAAVYVVTSGFAVASPLKGALDWLVPPFFRAAEYGTVLALAAVCEVNGALPAAFGLVAAVAYHHYDTVYRIRGGTGAPPRTLVRVLGGQEGRALAVTAVAAAFVGSTGFTVVLTALAVALAVLVLSESIRFWVSSQAPAVHDETGEPA